MNQQQKESLENTQQQYIIKYPGGNGYLDGNLFVNDITYLGAHNAGCSWPYGWIYHQQRATISHQIEFFGARFFKIPLHWFCPSKAYCLCCRDNSSIPQIVLAHEGGGKINCKLTILQRGFSFPQRAEIILHELGQMLQKYPQEVFILKIESYLLCGRSPANNTQNMEVPNVVQKIIELLEVSQLKDKAFPIKKQVIPKLHELRQGKNLLIFFDEKGLFYEGSPLSEYASFQKDYLCQTNWNDNPLEDKYSADLFYGTRGKDGIYIEPFFEGHFNPESSLHLFSYGKVYNKYENAKRRYQGLCKFYKKRLNIISADFIEEGQLTRVVDEANSQVILEQSKNLQFNYEQFTETDEKINDKSAGSSSVIQSEDKI